MSVPTIPPFQVNIRPQFTIQVTDEQLACVLTILANQSVNIVGYFIHKDKSTGLNTVKFVAGPTTSSDIAGTGTQNTTACQVLKFLDIPFKVKQVIQILNPSPIGGTPGVVRQFYIALSGHVSVKASYVGETNPGLGVSLIFETDDPQKAQIIAQNPQNFPNNFDVNSCNPCSKKKKCH